jgi:hypothetical protein
MPFPGLWGKILWNSDGQKTLVKQRRLLRRSHWPRSNQSINTNLFKHDKIFSTWII